MNNPDATPTSSASGLKILLIVAAVVLLFFAVLVAGAVGLGVALVHESPPARADFQRVDGEELVAVCRELMADPQRHGYYANAARQAKAAQDPRVRAHLARNTREPRPEDELPSVLRELEALEVRVSENAVSFFWYRRKPYGYSLSVYSAGYSVTTRNEGFSGSAELAPGVWSHYRRR